LLRCFSFRYAFRHFGAITLAFDFHIAISLITPCRCCWYFFRHAFIMIADISPCHYCHYAIFACSLIIARPIAADITPLLPLFLLRLFHFAITPFHAITPLFSLCYFYALSFYRCFLMLRHYFAAFRCDTLAMPCCDYFHWYFRWLLIFRHYFDFRFIFFADCRADDFIFYASAISWLCCHYYCFSCHDAIAITPPFSLSLIAAPCHYAMLFIFASPFFRFSAAIIALHFGCHYFADISPYYAIADFAIAADAFAIISPHYSYAAIDIIDYFADIFMLSLRHFDYSFHFHASLICHYASPRHCRDAAILRFRHFATMADYFHFHFHYFHFD